MVLMCGTQERHTGFWWESCWEIAIWKERYHMDIRYREAMKGVSEWLMVGIGVNSVKPLGSYEN
jgi:hypothetical protein